MHEFNGGEQFFKITNKSDSPIRYDCKKLQVLDYDYSFISFESRLGTRLGGRERCSGGWGEGSMDLRVVQTCVLYRPACCTDLRVVLTCVLYRPSCCTDLRVV